jgi:alpha-mannosidase
MKKNLIVYYSNRILCLLIKGGIKNICLILFVSINLSIMQAQDHSYFKNGTLHIINSSHQDIAWMDSPEACEKYRDENVITPVLKRLSENPDFRYSMEDALSLKEYLYRHPESYADILKYTREGRLEWGATFTQPYSSMFDGEALVRQTYYGRKWMRKILPNCDFRTAYNEDVPGVAIQLPQILAKAGIPYYHFSRHQPGLYRWFSPDGSSILAWTPGQYECASRPIRAAKGDKALTDSLSALLVSWNDYFKTRKMAPHFPFIYSYDFAVPINYDAFIRQWNEDVRSGSKVDFPSIQYSTGTMAFDEIAKKKDAMIDRLCGERPNVWLYIHGPSHQRALKAGRKASRILTTAEKFATIRSMVENSFSSYPSDDFYQAWGNVIFPDHGWGGYHGDVTDRLFRTKFELGLSAGKKILEDNLKAISNHISYKKNNKIAVTVFNGLSWKRSDPVQFTLDVEGRNNTNFCLVDEFGKEIDYQFISSHDIENGRDEVVTFLFIAKDIPAMGYKTYYLEEKKYAKKTIIDTGSFSSI